MKTIIAKEITGVAELTWYGADLGYKFTVDGKELGDLIGRRSGVNMKNATKVFPARVTICVEDLRDEIDTLPGVMPYDHN